MRVCFDDDRVVSDAGIALVATLAVRLGLEALVARFACPDRPGAANAGRKVMALIYAMALGADSIDDCPVLRAAAPGGAWGLGPAPSTLGTFLRAFTFGHVRQLDQVLGQALTRAWKAGAGPGAGRLVVDVDSFIGEVCGYQKQGTGYGYTKQLGYHPIVASRADTGEVLHVRLRHGSANTQRGMLRFTEELMARITRAGATGPKLLRGHSGFWNVKVFRRLEAAGWTYSIGIRMTKPVTARVSQIPEDAWTAIEDYPKSGEAHIAETTLGDRRVIVRRVRVLGLQDELFPTWAHFPFLTNRTEPIALVEVEHRQHAVVGLVIARPQRPSLGAFPLGSLSRQRRVDGDRCTGAQPVALDRDPGHPRRRDPGSSHHPPTATHAARTADSSRRPLDASPTRPLALARRLHQRAHPITSAPRRRLTPPRPRRPARPITPNPARPPLPLDPPPTTPQALLRPSHPDDQPAAAAQRPNPRPTSHNTTNPDPFGGSRFSRRGQPVDG